MNPTAPPPEWLTTDQVADLLQVSAKKLMADRKNGVGLPFTPIGRRTIRYRRADIARHLELATIIPR